MLAALRGLRRENQRGNRRQRDESEKTRREREDNARDGLRAEERAAREGADAVHDSEKRKRDEIKKTARERRKSTQAQRREARRVRRDAQLSEGRRSRGRGGLRGALGGALGGAGMAAIGVGRDMQSAFGIRSQMDVLGSMVDLRQEVIRQALAGGMRGNQVQGFIERAAGVANRTGVSPEQILGGVIIGQERFSDIGTAVEGGEQGMDDLFENLEFFARIARATGSSMEHVVGAAGEFTRQFGLDAEGTREAMRIVAEGALAGSLSLRDFAERFPGAIASFQAARGISGMDALREFQAIAQALRASGLDPRVARTYQENLLGNLSNPRVQRNLRELGLDVTNEAGDVRSMAEIASMAADNEQLGNLGVLTTALGQQEAARAFSMVRQQELRARAGQAGTLTMAQRVNVDPAHADQVINETLVALNQDASGGVIRQRIEREAMLVAESDKLIERFSALSGVLTKLEDQSPMLTNVAAPLAGGAGIGVALSGLAGKLGIGGAATAATGGTAAAGAGAAGGGGLLAAGGTGVASAGAGMIAAAVGAGLALAGVATAGISATGMFSETRIENGEVKEVSLLDQWGEILSGESDAMATAFSGDFLETLETVFSGPSVAEDPREVLARRREEQRTVTLDEESTRRLANAVQAGREPGAGRRAEGSPGR